MSDETYLNMWIMIMDDFALRTPPLTKEESAAISASIKENVDRLEGDQA